MLLSHISGSGACEAADVFFSVAFPAGNVMKELKNVIKKM